MSVKIEASEPFLLFDNPATLHNYHGWSTITRLHDGKLAVVCSGLRLTHVCPFGTVLMSESADEGETWSNPRIVINTVLDDRDAGICAFGENDVIVTSFNNTPQIQRQANAERLAAVKNGGDAGFSRIYGADTEAACRYIDGYLDFVESSADHLKYLGSTFTVSRDNGISFGELHTVPVTSPHGPLAMPDGTLYYVGTVFDMVPGGKSEIAAYRIYPDGRTEKVCTVARGDGVNYYFCEPHAVLLPDGKIIVHIRVQGCSGSTKPCFTVFQCESTDGGLTYSEPRQLLSDLGGAPPHLTLLPDGNLLSAYGYRQRPYGIRCMISRDNGETWDTDHVLVKYEYGTGLMSDLGYPSTVALKDGSLLTVYYAHTDTDEPAKLYGVRWRYSF